MPTEVLWGNTEQTIQHVKYNSPVTVQEIADVQEVCAQQLDQSARRVVGIADFTRVSGAPLDLIIHLSKLGKHRIVRHPNLIQVICVTESIFIEDLLRIYSRMYAHMAVAASLEEAYGLAAALLSEHQAGSQ